MATATKKAKRFYKLKAGSHAHFETVADEAGNKTTRIVRQINSSDPKNNWVESHENLAAQEPARWEEINGLPPSSDVDDEETDIKFMEPPPPKGDDVNLPATGRIVNLPTDREARRRFLEKQMKALEEEEAAAEGDGDSPTVDEAIKHKQTLTGKSDSADAALEEFEAQQKKGRAAAKETKAEGKADEKDDLEGKTVEELKATAAKEGVEHTSEFRKDDYVKAIRKARKKG